MKNINEIIKKIFSSIKSLWDHSTIFKGIQSNDKDNSEKTSEDELKAITKPAIIFGLTTLLIGFLLFIVWGGTASLDSASIASGYIIPSGHNKTVQHYEGGVIKEIMVDEGNIVSKGQVLIRLDNNYIKAELLTLKEQLHAFNAIHDRLIAERDGLKQIEFHQKDKDVSDVMINQISYLKLELCL